MEELHDSYIYHFMWTHCLYIYIDIPIKYGYICIYVSSNFILCASLLIPKKKRKFSLIMWKERILSYQPKPNRNVNSNIWWHQYCRSSIAQKCANFQMIWYFYSKMLQITVLQLKKTYNLEIKNEELCNLF